MIHFDIEVQSWVFMHKNKGLIIKRVTLIRQKELYLCV